MEMKCEMKLMNTKIMASPRRGPNRSKLIVLNLVSVTWRRQIEAILANRRATNDLGYQSAILY